MKWIAPITLLIIAIVSTFIRLHALTAESVWLDEALSVSYASQPLSSLLLLTKTTPPLYYLVLKTMILMRGLDPFWLRIPSVLFGVGCVFMTYVLGAKMFNRKTGLVAAAFLAFSPFHIVYSQEARSYTLFVFLAAVSMYAYVLYSEHASWKRKGGYLLATTALLYTHSFAIFVLLAQNAHWLVTRKNWRDLARIQALALVFILPWIITSLLSFESKYLSWVTKADVLSTMKVPYFLLGSSISVGISILLMAVALRKKSEHKNQYLLIFWMSVPFVLPVIFSLLFQPILVPRYLLIASVPFFLLVACGINQLHRFVQPVLITALLLLAVPMIQYQASSHEKFPWQEIESSVPRDHYILVEPGFYEYPYQFYRGYCITTEDIDSCSQSMNVIPIWHREEYYRFSRLQEFYVLLVDPRNVLEDPSALNVFRDSFAIQKEGSWTTSQGGEVALYALRRDKINAPEISFESRKNGPNYSGGVPQFPQ